MPSATLLYSFPTPLDRRSTTVLAVVSLHVLLALGLIISTRLAPPAPPEPAPQVTWRPAEPVPEPTRRHVDPAAPRWTGQPVIEIAPDFPPVVGPHPEAPPGPQVVPEGPPPDAAAWMTPPRVLNGPPPLYPAAERRLQHEGVVRVRVKVSASGRAEQVELAASSGHSRLDEAAIAAVRGWIFAPAQNATGPLSSWVTLTVRFQLTG